MRRGHFESQGKRRAYLLHHGDEREPTREHQAGKRIVRRGQASIKRTDVIRLGRDNLLSRDLLGPEPVGFQGLLDAVLG